MLKSNDMKTQLADTQHTKVTTVASDHREALKLQRGSGGAGGRTMATPSRGVRPGAASSLPLHSRAPGCAAASHLCTKECAHAAMVPASTTISRATANHG